MIIIKVGKITYQFWSLLLKISAIYEKIIKITTNYEIKAYVKNKKLLGYEERN